MATFTSRKAGTGPDFFTGGLRVSRMFRMGDRLRLDGLVEGFNPTNQKNAITMFGNS